MLYKNACGNVERDVGTVVIEGKEVQRSEYRGQPVLTLARLTSCTTGPNKRRTGISKSIENSLLMMRISLTSLIVNGEVF